MATNYLPEGHNNVSPYLITREAAQVIDLLKTAFGGTELMCMRDPEGRVAHAEVKVGDSVIMLSEGNEQFPARPAAVHIYLPDVDAAYQRALRAGAKSEREPADQFYGDRSAGVVDAGGNSWWLATHKEDLSEEEINRRAAAAGK
jgi:PhnB protein